MDTVTDEWFGFTAKSEETRRPSGWMKPRLGMFRGGCSQQEKIKLNKITEITALLQPREFTTE